MPITISTPQGKQEEQKKDTLETIGQIAGIAKAGADIYGNVKSDSAPQKPQTDAMKRRLGK